MNFVDIAVMVSVIILCTLLLIGALWGTFMIGRRALMSVRYIYYGIPDSYSGVSIKCPSILASTDRHRTKDYNADRIYMDSTGLVRAIRKDFWVKSSELAPELLARVVRHGWVADRFSLLENMILRNKMLSYFEVGDLRRDGYYGTDREREPKWNDMMSDELGFSGERLTKPDVLFKGLEVHLAHYLSKLEGHRNSHEIRQFAEAQLDFTY